MRTISVQPSAHGHMVESDPNNAMATMASMPSMSAVAPMAFAAPIAYAQVTHAHMAVPMYDVHYVEVTTTDSHNNTGGGTMKHDPLSVHVQPVLV